MRAFVRRGIDGRGGGLDGVGVDGLGPRRLALVVEPDLGESLHS